jgi:hypothetical protein
MAFHALGLLDGFTGSAKGRTTRRMLMLMLRIFFVLVVVTVAVWVREGVR